MEAVIRKIVPLSYNSKNAKKKNHYHQIRSAYEAPIINRTIK